MQNIYSLNFGGFTFSVPNKIAVVLIRVGNHINVVYVRIKLGGDSDSERDCGSKSSSNKNR